VKFALRIFFIFAMVWIFIRGSIYLLPGDPVDYLVNESLIQAKDEKTITEIKQRLDLDLSFENRIFSLPSEFSVVNGKLVYPMLKDALIHSCKLASLTFLISIIMTFTLLYLGYLSKRWKEVGEGLSIFLASVPIFISGPLLLFLFSIKINLFPAMNSPILPAFCLGIYLTGFWFRSVSQKIDAYLPISAVSGARARGMDEFRIFIFYLIAPCLGSLIRFFSSQVGNIFNGSLIVELIFKWEGIGFLLADSINHRDYPLIESLLIIISSITLISLQIGKWLQVKMEPRQQ
jgi:ABC-type dipeptide/oligopeptide/nickel transport system permease component